MKRQRMHQMRIRTSKTSLIEIKAAQMESTQQKNEILTGYIQSGIITGHII